VQVEAPELLKVPVEQLEHAELPDPEKVPATHGNCSDCPVSPTKLPASAREHSAALSSGENLPASQGLHSLAAVAENVPVGHVIGSEAPGVATKDPGLERRQAVWPANAT